MTFAERVLYHQVHPLKIATDIGATVVAIPLLWNGDLALGLAIVFLSPVVGSTIVMATADLAPYRDGAIGAYLRRYMGPLPQAIRLALGLTILFAAWIHNALVIVICVLLVAVVWLNGILRA